MPRPTKPPKGAAAGAAEQATQADFWARHWMLQALQLAAQGRGRTAPNPLVGALVVRRGRLVGSGWHQQAGLAHAEPQALAQAGAQARGADLYVTLEPCHHVGRTGPCTAAILAAGVARVFVASHDPDVRVQGRGIAYLRQHGVEVVEGVCEAEAERLNAAYLQVKRTGIAYVVAKMAQSLDGCVASRTGASQWITCVAARERGYALRNRVDAIVVGRGTVLADDPQLTCRLPGGRNPARVIFASRGEVPLEARVLQQGGAAAGQTYVVVGPQAPAARCRALRRLGATVVQVAAGPGGVCVRQSLQALAGLGLHAVLVEGGPSLLGRFFDAQLVRRLYAFVAPTVLGGAGRHSVLGEGVGPLQAACRLVRAEMTPVGADWLLRGDVVFAAKAPR